MPIRDDSLGAQYIRAIENPDSVGFKDNRWYQGPHNPNNRGFGVDVVKNKATAKFVANRKGKWLTEDEERKLRNEHIDYVQNALDGALSPYLLRKPISENKRAMAIGMLYRGDSVTQNSKILDAYLNGTDEDMQKAVSDFYLDTTPKSRHYQPERSRLHNQFFNPQKKNTSNNIPASIQKPKSYISPSYEPEQFVSGKKYDNGGYLGNDWGSLSYRDKADIMKVAIDNGITTLPEIKDAYNEFAKGGRLEDWTVEDEAGYRYWRSKLPRNLRNTNDNDYDMRAAYKAGMEPQWNEEDKSYHLGSRDPRTGRILKAPHHPTYLKALATDASLGYYPTMDSDGNTYTETWRGNQYGEGGNLGNNTGGNNNSYVPSSRVKRDIAIWEGSQMKKNNSFESMTKQFNDTIPSNIRARLTQGQLDALYSYGYNVGMGKLRDRVLPTLTNYIQGRATNEDVQNSMTATLDSKYRGLAKRREWERGMFGGNYWEPHGKPVKTSNAKTLGSHINLTNQMLPQQYFDNLNSQIGGTFLPLPTTGNLNLEVDPSTSYVPPVMSTSLFTAPQNEEPFVAYNPQQERMDNLNRFGNAMGVLEGNELPFTNVLTDNNTPGIMQYINAIYGS